MTLGVQSYPELYTTLLGWQLYDEIWDLLSQTGLAFLPFIGIVLRNITHPYTSQETKDAGSTSLRRMEVDFISTLLFIFFAVSPALTLDPTVLVLHAVVSNQRLNPALIIPAIPARRMIRPLPYPRAIFVCRFGGMPSLHFLKALLRAQIR